MAQKLVKHQPYNLSYPITTVSWTGTYVVRMPDETFLPVCHDLKELGVNELMLVGYVTVEEADFDMMQETKRIGKLLSSMGMKPAQHHGLSALYATDSTSQAPVVERLIRSLQYTANLGSPVLVIHPAHYYNPAAWKQGISVIDMYEASCRDMDVVATVADNLHQAGEEAQRLGVKIALENVDRFEPMGNIRLLPEIIRRADSPAVGFCLDAGHAHCCGQTTPVQWIQEMGHKLFTTHFHDNHGPDEDVMSSPDWINPSKVDEHLPPGFGTIPWTHVIRALWESGYNHTVNFESGEWPGKARKQGYAAAIDYWRTCEWIADRN